MTKPEDCLTPDYHDGPFRYCPSCTWTEADEAGLCPARIVIGSHEYRCESYDGHHGDHHVNPFGLFDKPGKVTWSDD